MTKKPFAVNITLLPALVPPDYGAYAQVVIDEGMISGEAKPILIYAEQPKVSGSN